jgi:hypothetical protein
MVEATKSPALYQRGSFVSMFSAIARVHLFRIVDIDTDIWI